MKRRLLAGVSLALIVGAFAASTPALAKPAPNYAASLTVTADCTVTSVATWHYIKVDEVQTAFWLDGSPGAFQVDNLGAKGSRDVAKVDYQVPAAEAHTWQAFVTFYQNGNPIGWAETQVVSANCAQ